MSISMALAAPSAEGSDVRVPGETYFPRQSADEWAWELSEFGRDVLLALNAVFNTLGAGPVRTGTATELAEAIR